MITLIIQNPLKYIDNADGKDYGQYVQFNSIIQLLLKAESIDKAWQQLNTANLLYFNVTLEPSLEEQKSCIIVYQIDNEKFKENLILIAKDGKGT